MSDLRLWTVCPVCEDRRLFVSPDDYFSCREKLRAAECKWNGCLPRHRALARALFSIYPRESMGWLRIHESSPGPVGVSYWLRRNAPGYVMSGYFPDHEFGRVVNGMRNEDLEKQTFADAEFDVVIHLDVMEHLFHPFRALAEIYRTLRTGGTCLFTAPTYAGRTHSEQVAFREPGEIRVVGAPEYHGNPQSKTGSLVTWRYGYDLPYLIAARTGFDVEVRRWHAPTDAIMGTMTEVYILRKTGRAEQPSVDDSIASP